jgi:hypothetical protein
VLLFSIPAIIEHPARQGVAAGADSWHASAENTGTVPRNRRSSNETTLEKEFMPV